MDNKIFLDNLKSVYSNLNEIDITNNTLLYNGESINLGSFNINTLYDEVANIKSDIGSLSSEDLFNIIRIHVLINSIKGMEYEFFYLIKLPTIPVHKVDNINKFNAFIYEEMKYRDYLNKDCLELLNSFTVKMEELDINSEDRNISSAASEELSKYHIMCKDIEILLNSRSESVNLKLVKNERLKLSAGYINIFIMIIGTLITGIVVGCLMLLSIK